MAVKCGNCKESHNSVAEIKSCYNKAGKKTEVTTKRRPKRKVKKKTKVTTKKRPKSPDDRPLTPSEYPSYEDYDADPQPWSGHRTGERLEEAYDLEFGDYE